MYLSGAILALALVVLGIVYWFRPKCFFAEEWLVYWASLVGMIMLPLVPMLLEWLAKGDISFQTATISAAIFASSNGITSRRDFIMYLCILIAMVMCFLFGAGILGKELVHKSVPFLSIFFVAFTIVVERYTLHVVELKPFRN